MKKNYLICLSIFVFSIIKVSAQVLDAPSIDASLVSKFIAEIDTKLKQTTHQLEKQTHKMLKKIQRQEEKLLKKIAKPPSATNINQILNTDSLPQLRNLIDSINKLDALIPNTYDGYIDSLKTALSFLRGNSVLNPAMDDKIQTISQKITQLQGRFSKMEGVKHILQQRRQILQTKLGDLGLGKQILRLNKKASYYQAYINEYKAILRNPGHLEKKVIAKLTQTALFRNFFAKHSLLATLFRLPENGTSTELTSGLQTRTGLQNMIQQQFGNNTSSIATLKENVQNAQAQLNAMKDRIMQGQEEIAMPDFKPNQQKTKRFLQRLEMAVNFQTSKSKNFFPAIGDIGLSLGYKLNNKSMLGVGASYKLGFGTSFRHIQLSSEGVGLRSFVEYRIAKSLWLAGGYEMNYRSSFNSIEALKKYSAWQRSGLMGLSKVIALKSKRLTKTKVQILWDFLSYQQVPATQPVVFRLAYCLK